MVFGWGKKREPERQVPQTQNIMLPDVTNIASRLVERRESQTVAEIILHRNHIMPLLREISDIGAALEADSLDTDDIDRNIRVIVVRGKKQVIDVIKKDIVELPPVSSYNDAVLLHKTLSQTLKKIGDTLGRQTRVIHIFAKKYAAKLKDILAEINSGNSDIQKLLRNFESTAASSAEISGLLEQISGLEGFNRDARQKVSSLRASIVTYDDKILACSESIREIKSSAQYGKLLKEKARADQLATQTTRLQSKVVDQFTKISRPLGRYEYASSLDKVQKLLLSGLIKSPFNIINSENRDTILMILENVKKGIESGSISVKDRAKSLSQVTDVAESLDGMISEISEHFSERVATYNAIRKLTSAELPVLEKEMEKLAAAKSSTESKIRSLEGEVAANASRIPAIIDEIEAKLYRLSNTRYSIRNKN